MTDYEKAIKKADTLIAKAKAYRDKHGYRENLGYDDVYKLEQYIDAHLKLTYPQECEVKNYFYKECEKI